jgi:DNA replication protein DnaC
MQKKSSVDQKEIRGLAKELCQVKIDMKEYEEKLKPLKQKEKEKKERLFKEMKAKRLERIHNCKGYNITFFSKKTPPKINKEFIERMISEYLKTNSGIAPEKVADFFDTWRKTSSKSNEGLRVAPVSEKKAAEAAAAAAAPKDEEPVMEPLDLFGDDDED